MGHGWVMVKYLFCYNIISLCCQFKLHRQLTWLVAPHGRTTAAGREQKDRWSFTYLSLQVLCPAFKLLNLFELHGLPI